MAAHAGLKWWATDPGPYQGRVIIWKLQSSPHIDEHDACPTITCPMGLYAGGYMDILELNARLFYRPGDIIIGWTSHLLHRVTDFTTPVATKEEKDFMETHNLTPGRIGTVHLFREKEYAVFKEKKAGWGKDTMYGQREYASKAFFK